MPVQNGLNVLRELVSEPDHPPVIFATAQEDVSNGGRSHAYGCH